MNTVIYSDPVFYDKKVQELNTALEALTWLQNQYPICRVGEVDEGTFPEVYYNSGSVKNLKVMPQGRAVSFFTVNGDISETEEDPYYLVPLSIFVWADLTKIYPQKKYDYTGELIKDVIGILNDNSCTDKVIVTDNVFVGFTMLEKVLKQNVMRPYTSFRINFQTLITKC